MPYDPERNKVEAELSGVRDGRFEAAIERQDILSWSEGTRHTTYDRKGRVRQQNLCLMFKGPSLSSA
jgi:hypothetical protein